ncbi:MAG: hypothetical protein K5799_05105 [Erythrobacter sp.]|nr:hypothetical protein [Erythrobacter sp.]
MTKTTPSTNSMRRAGKIRTSCPNKSSSAHDHVEAENRAFDPTSPEARELEALYRDTRNLEALAAHHARRCNADADDLLSAAIVHALRCPQWNSGVEGRVDGILSSHAYTINRTRKRMKLKGVELIADNDGSIIDTNWPTHRDPLQEIEREQRRAGATKALDMIAGDDPKMRSLIDGICRRERGRKLRGSLGITELELAALRRRLKRTAQAVCVPLCIDGAIDPDLLQEFAA